MSISISQSIAVSVMTLLFCLSVSQSKASICNYENGDGCSDVVTMEHAGFHYVWTQDDDGNRFQLFNGRILFTSPGWTENSFYPIIVGFGGFPVFGLPVTLLMDGGVISDAIGIRTDGYFGFISDQTETGLTLAELQAIFGLNATFVQVPEGPLAIDVSQYTGDPTTFRSDIDPPVAAPEPSTIALIGMALLSLFGFGLIRRRAAV